MGRSDLLDDFAVGLDAGPGAPERVTLYTGARGTGKTVMLNQVEDIARRQGWRVIPETATPGFVARLVDEHLPALLAEIDPEATGSTLTGVSAPMGLGGATWQPQDAHLAAPGLRAQLTRVCDLLVEGGTGLLVTFDEVHHHQVAELRDLATAVQHLVREERAIAFVGAGLPSAVSAVLNDEVITFLRRAAEATGGYPFLIQLVGYHLWRRHPRDQTITVDDVEAGIIAARRRLGSLVHEPALADLPGVAAPSCWPWPTTTAPRR